MNPYTEAKLKDIKYFLDAALDGRITLTTSPADNDPGGHVYSIQNLLQVMHSAACEGLGMRVPVYKQTGLVIVPSEKENSNDA